MAGTSLPNEVKQGFELPWLNADTELCAQAKLTSVGHSLVAAAICQTLVCSSPIGPDGDKILATRR